MLDIPQTEEEATPPAPEETANDDERTLIMTLVYARKEADDLEKEAKEASKRADEIEAKLMKLLEDDEKRSSAKYEGLGHVTIIDGATFASIEKGRKPEVIDHLKNIGREDLVEVTVQAGKLSTYVRECLSQNEDIPPGVTYYKKRWLNFYPVK